jgi:hypothetical protein
MWVKIALIEPEPTIRRGEVTADRSIRRGESPSENRTHRVFNREDRNK